MVNRTDFNVEKGRGPGALRFVVSGTFCIATWRNDIFKEPWYFVKINRVVLMQMYKQSLNPGPLVFIFQCSWIAQSHFLTLLLKVMIAKL